MIDLSFLTEEEQEAIQAVLQRDAALKKIDERRVQKLQRTTTDKDQLKYMTGDWFYEAKMLRHKDRIHGSDIIRASIKRSPLTILEISQVAPERPSFIASENKEVFVPPELSGLLQEPHRQPSTKRDQRQRPDEKPVLHSSTKERPNPFNSQLSALAPIDEVEHQLLDEPEDQTQISCIEDDSSPVGSALKHLPSRSMSSRSLENLSGMGNKVTSSTEDEGARSDTRHDIVITVDDVSEPSSSSPPPPPLSLSRSKEMKMSSSVPILQMDEADSDGAFEHVDWRRSTGSSASNLSLSSGMASMSSISSSTMSLYRTDYGNLEVQGTIQFALNYIQKLAEFHIFVVQCKDLAVAEPKKNRSDPYVKCYLLPYKTKMGKKKTSVKKKSVNPTYNEILRFKIVMEELKRQNLNVSVWHNDTFGRNAFLGEVDLDLSEWDFNNTQINEYTLKPRASVQPSTPSESFEFDGAAEMRVALRFLPQMSHSKKMSNIETGEVQIWVKDCKNLRPVRDAIIDPFVKCTVLPDMSRKNRQKTRVVRRTSNPMFNHTMVYDGLRPSDLREACMEITVWDHDKRTNHFIGGLRLGLGTGKSYGVDAVWMDSTQDEAHLWQKMMMSHGEWVEDVLPLRMFLMARSMPK
ncbi:synaptotagmin-like protein 2 isoform X7 [Thalassophryne amazonica]|uniref:synaptotagmin-like protein 2 isoform X7 n=1 Tax=Thalassophryne amazonica TaxID=390379 RepID=UPI001471EF13|nr:synaptotagmin-like protein 2 isoform X7 [Thalassophryne amazonica]